MTEPLQDSHGRKIEYMRLSLTEACNFGCLFCMPPGQARPSHNDDGRLSSEEFLRLCGIFSHLGIDKYKITGGEPFMNPEAVAIMAGLKRDCGARSVTVTTNGSTLGRHIDGLLRAAVDCVNVSLNGVSPEVHAAMAGGRGDSRKVLDGVLAARGAGLEVKLNVVPIRGVNEADIAPILEFALENGLTVRFIELMPLGEGRKYRGLSRADVEGIVEARFGKLTPVPGRLGNGPAAYATVPGYSAKIGYIAAVSGNFCAGCNRIRLTSSGFLKTCLHHSLGADLAGPLRRGDPDQALAALIRRAVFEKPERHRFGTCPATSQAGGEPMYRIGG